ncbi:MAG: mannonate dehydratase [Cyclobacteriaceae bacterium]|nr:mannonate dehydratase [Cyclobacteriaceae bacterium]
MSLEKTWRWFGFDDEVKLGDLKQIGIEGVVTALHHVPNGEVWFVDDIMKVRDAIETHGMSWSVVESLPVSEGIKVHSADWGRLIDNYKQSIRNLGSCGIDTVCYNFMPVIDWVRTDLHHLLPGGGEVMFFNFPVFVAFDAFILKRPGAENDYPSGVVEKARLIAASLSEAEADDLAYNIIVVTQGFIDGTVDESTSEYRKTFLDHISAYDRIDASRLREHLSDFLGEVVPVAEDSGVKLCIHPDDPPFPLLGLPRIVSTLEDLQWICNQYDSIYNGITFCTGSLSVRRDNNLEEMVKKLASRIHFAHLRNNNFTDHDNFYESGHIDGRVDMYSIMKALLEEQRQRMNSGRPDFRMPFRPDHGTKMLDDFSKIANPGYPLIGRLKGLAELTGMEYAIEQQLKFKEQ